MIAPLQVIDVHAAAPATMSAPTISSFTDLSVKIAFVAPSSDETITDYEVKQSTDDVTFTAVPTPVGTGLFEEIYGLTADTTYYFTVAAISSDGTGTHSSSVSQKTLGAAAFTDFSGGSQDFSAGKSFGEGTQFIAGQSFSAGTMTFGANQQFGAGTEFAAGQSFSSGVQTFTGSQTFGTGSTFAAGQNFDSGQTFSGTQNFGAGTQFAADAEFASSQEFGTAQTFGTGATFGDSTTFGATNVFSENMDFSAGTHTFSAAQEFKKGASFGDSQSFGAGESHDFTGDSMTFGLGTDFGAARTFGTAMTFTGTQNWNDDVHVFGADPLFTGVVNFADNQTFPAGASFAAGQTFASGEDYTFGSHMDFGNAPEFGKARTFGAGTFFGGSASPDMGGFANIFADGGHMPAAQAFTAAQTFGEHMHFGDNTDFTGATQTFKAGAHFGDGTTFAVGQSLPTSIVPPFGLMLSTFSCLDATCIPGDPDAYLAPGEFLTPGVDPDPISSTITKDSKSIEMDGLGFAMTFNGDVSTAGTVSVDPIDPATLVGSNEVTTTSGARSLNADGGSYQTMGTVMDITMGTAVTTGSMDITVEYDESNIPAGALESTLEVVHHTGTSWITEDNCTQDTTNNKFTCTVTTLSPVGVGAPSSSSSSGGTCAQCKVLRTHGGFAINDQTYTLVKKYNDIDTNVVKTGEPVTITLSVPVANGASRVTSTILYMDVYGSPNNYKHSPSISYSPNVTDKIAINDKNGLWSSVDVESEVVQHPIHQTAYRTNYTFTMIFDKTMDTSHIVTETTNHYGIPEVLYVLNALDVVENDGNYAD
ncbi:MAG: hypothetical protein NZ838_05390, partial [Candidatus Marinimicrobia bacterium]|nr:hypothetical protein [Candidatus Neomarinimicrobiota bacterium]